MDWYYALEGRQYGPVSWEELQRLARGGRLAPTDYIWNSTMGQHWAQASTVPDLFSSASPLQTGVRPVQSAIPPMQVGVPPVVTWPAYASGALPRSEELRGRARASLRGNWGNAVAAFLIYEALLFVVGLLPPPVGGIVQIIIMGPLELGLAILFLTIARRYPASLSRMFEGFNNLATAINATVLRALFTLLWSLLLIVPGIVAAYSYRMTFYIIADVPGTGPLTAIRRSKHMMDGHKGRLFCLDLSFIGWALLCVLTLGIGFLWLAPYMKAAEIAFYDDLRARAGTV
jgi:uncharacterized membrane protein